jgi:hypothetical protein
MAGKELVQQGICWGIGNGVHTRILTDNWIPAVRPDQITTITPLTQGATVSTLIDPDT